MAMRCAGPQPFTSRCPTVGANHVGLRPGLIDEDKLGRIEIELPLEPVLPLLQNVWPVLLGRVEGLFFRVMAWRAKKRWIVPKPKWWPRLASA